MIRVLCDAIHADLWESLRLLFEVRMGWELYRPIGMEWNAAGIWRFEQHQPYGAGVAHQFLDPWDSDTPNHVHGHDCWCGPEDRHQVRGSDPALGSWTERADTTHPPQVQRLVTMEQAAELRPDLVLATLAENELGWRQWADDHGAHYGIQVGNQDAANVWAAAEFGLLSVTTPGFTPWKPHVTYRQEFDLNLFHADGGAGALTTPVVMNRVQCTTQTPDYQTFRDLAAAIPEGHFRWYGHCEPRDELFGGDHHTTAEVAASMHGARIAFHAKRWSDGYGHVIHNWAAIGRPMLVTAGYYQDKLAGPLFVEGVTSYDLQTLGRGDLEAVTRRLIHDDDHWRRMCENAAARFREVVSFDAEAEQIRTMLENVMSDRVTR
jgi:hypothetical protein